MKKSSKMTSTIIIEKKNRQNQPLNHAIEERTPQKQTDKNIRIDTHTSGCGGNTKCGEVRKMQIVQGKKQQTESHAPGIYPIYYRDETTNYRRLSSGHRHELRKRELFRTRKLGDTLVPGGTGRLLKIRNY